MKNKTLLIGTGIHYITHEDFKIIKPKDELIKVNKYFELDKKGYKEISEEEAKKILY